MVRKKLKTYVVLGVAVSTLIASGSTAFAATGGSEMLADKPDKATFVLQAEGAITQETADKITTYMETKQSEKADLFTELVNEGIVTQEEADAICDAMPQRTAGFGHRAEMFKADFINLVEEGVITQETADQMSAYMEEQTAACKDAATPQKTKAFDIFSGMVDSGILTQAQADTIKSAMPTRSLFSETEAATGTPKMFTIKHQLMDFGNLVAEGVITQDTADKITAFIETKQSEKTDPFTELLNEGVSTQEEADAIHSAMPTRSLSGEMKDGVFFKTHIDNANSLTQAE